MYKHANTDRLQGKHAANASIMLLAATSMQVAWCLHQGHHLDVGLQYGVLTRLVCTLMSANL